MSGPAPREVLSTIVESGPDGVLLSAGMLATNADLFARRGAPVPVVRADWTVIDEAWKADSGEFHRVVVTPAEAVGDGRRSDLHVPHRRSGHRRDVRRQRRRSREGRPRGLTGSAYR